MQAQLQESNPAETTVERSEAYRRIERALGFLATNPESGAIDLERAAEAVGLSPFHFQREFTRWVGISPKRFQQYLSLEAAKRSLTASASVLDAALDAGLSGPSRLHDLMVTYEAATPGEFKRQGEGMTLQWGVHPSPFGDCLIIASPRGIVGLGFVDTPDPKQSLSLLTRNWQAARLVESPIDTAAYIPLIFRDRLPKPETAPLKLYLQGTPFQVKVWEALLTIPPGGLATYSMLAKRLGYAGGQAARAVGTANGRNPVSVLIPCHRVIRATGHVGGYLWGAGRKLALIGWEQAQRENHAA